MSAECVKFAGLKKLLATNSLYEVAGYKMKIIAKSKMKCTFLV